MSEERDITELLRSNIKTANWAVRCRAADEIERLRAKVADLEFMVEAKGNLIVDLMNQAHGVAMTDAQFASADAKHD
jgi:hypothetical protein